MFKYHGYNASQRDGSIIAGLTPITFLEYRSYICLSPIIWYSTGVHRIHNNIGVVDSVVSFKKLLVRATSLMYIKVL